MTDDRDHPPRPSPHRRPGAFLRSSEPPEQRHRAAPLPPAGPADRRRPPGAGGPAQRENRGPRGGRHHHHPVPRRGHQAARRRGVRRAAGDRGGRLRHRDRAVRPAGRPGRARSAGWTGPSSCSPRPSPSRRCADDDVARHVQLRLAEIEQGRANSASRATTEFRRAVFAPDSRAARMNGGEPETVSARHRGRRRGLSTPTATARTGPTLVLAGDLTGIDVEALAERTFGGWHNAAQRRAPQQRAEPGGRTARAGRPAGCRAGRPAAGGVRRGPHRPALGRPDRRRLRDGRGLPVPAQQGAARGAGLHLRGAARRSPRCARAAAYAVQGSFRTEVVVDAVRRGA